MAKHLSPLLFLYLLAFTCSSLQVALCIRHQGEEGKQLPVPFRPVPLREQEQGNECQIDKINALEPTNRVRSEAGVTEFWDPNEDQFRCAGVAFMRRFIEPNGLLLPYFRTSPELYYVIKGKGIRGMSLPGCPETYQSVSRGEESEGRFRDQHQRILRFRQGDVFALPAGVVQWLFNDGDEDLILVNLIDTTNEINQLDQSIPRGFFLAGNPQQEFQEEQGSQRGQQGIKNILEGFDLEILVEVLGLPRETVERLRSSEDDKRGQIVRAEQLRVIRPPIMREDEQWEERHRGQEEWEEHRRRGTGGRGSEGEEWEEIHRGGRGGRGTRGERGEEWEEIHRRGRGSRGGGHRGGRGSRGGEGEEWEEIHRGGRGGRGGEEWEESHHGGRGGRGSRGGEGEEWEEIHRGRKGGRQGEEGRGGRGSRGGEGEEWEETHRGGRGGRGGEEWEESHHGGRGGRGSRGGEGEEWEEIHRGSKGGRQGEEGQERGGRGSRGGEGEEWEESHHGGRGGRGSRGGEGEEWEEIHRGSKGGRQGEEGQEREEIHPGGRGRGSRGEEGREREEIHRGGRGSRGEEGREQEEIHRGGRGSQGEEGEEWEETRRGGRGSGSRGEEGREREEIHGGGRGEEGREWEEIRHGGRGRGSRGEEGREWEETHRGGGRGSRGEEGREWEEIHHGGRGRGSRGEEGKEWEEIHRGGRGEEGRVWEEIHHGGRGRGSQGEEGREWEEIHRGGRGRGSQGEEAREWEEIHGSGRGSEGQEWEEIHRRGRGGSGRGGQRREEWEEIHRRGRGSYGWGGCSTTDYNLLNAVANDIQQPICTLNTRASINDPSRADIYVPQAGRLTSLTSSNLPILRELHLSAERGVLYKNAIMAPHWSLNAHNLIYATRGSARVQIVNERGQDIFHGVLRENQLVVAPQNFVLVKQAGDEGFEWVSFKTDDNAIVQTVAGSTSYIKALPIEVIMSSYQVSRDEAERLKNERKETLLLAGRSRSSVEREPERRAIA
ncbi:hypothetical protein V2J09_024020 [Rumex salicifolius]